MGGYVMAETLTNGSPFDSTFVIKLLIIMAVGVVAGVIGFIIVGVLAFRKNDEKAMNAYITLFAKGDVLRLLTVAGILAAVLALTFARLVDGPVAASILSGIAGYVLGGLAKASNPQQKSLAPATIEKTKAEPGP
jgi:lysylphosphatidylglycerol synthetase-like protein (DUF2156 family)